MYEFLDYLVGDVMTKSPIAVSPSTTLRAVASLFERHDFNGVPVVDEDQRLLGVMTKLDLLKAFRFTDESLFPRYEEIMERNVETVMSRVAQSVEPTEHLTRVLEKMVDNGCKSFPVVEWDRVVGIVAREDILAALERASRGEPVAKDREDSGSAAN